MTQVFQSIYYGAILHQDQILKCGTFLLEFSLHPCRSIPPTDMEKTYIFSSKHSIQRVEKHIQATGQEAGLFYSPGHGVRLPGACHAIRKEKAYIHRHIRHSQHVETASISNNSTKLQLPIAKLH